MKSNSVATILCGVCLLLVAACGQSGGATEASNKPTALHVTLPGSQYPTSLLHPVDKTITDAQVVQRLYTAAISQPVVPKSPSTSCPAELPDDPTYHLVFLNGRTVLQTADLEATGCQFLRFGPNDVRSPDPAFLALFQRTLAS